MRARAATLDGNTGGLEVSSNTMSAPVKINDNCAGNSPTLQQSGNTVNGPHSGQCK
ncbi:hypothetical protein [Streptomyces sp. NPDC007205]|uniref:hypothetical protein n=1 Tax=Streptomyces sp. NPDC007205 TaxID=3154316 RepID=UPI0033E906C8